MRLRFHDLNFNSKSKNSSCECQSKSTTDSLPENPLSRMNRENAAFYEDQRRTRDASQPELEQQWTRMEAASRDKIARAVAKDSPTEGLRLMNQLNRARWAAQGVRS